MDVLAMHIRLYKTPTVNYAQIKSCDETKVPEDFFELEAYGSLKTRYTRKRIFEEKSLEMGMFANNYIILFICIFLFKRRSKFLAMPFFGWPVQFLSLITAR